MRLMFSLSLIISSLKLILLNRWAAVGSHSYSRRNCTNTWSDQTVCGISWQSKGWKQGQYGDVVQYYYLHYETWCSHHEYNAVCLHSSYVLTLLSFSKKYNYSGFNLKKCKKLEVNVNLLCFYCLDYKSSLNRCWHKLSCNEQVSTEDNLFFNSLYQLSSISVSCWLPVP